MASNEATEQLAPNNGSANITPAMTASSSAAVSPKTAPTSSTPSPAATTTRPSSSPAARMIAEDERRMKFLALLCGSGAFPVRYAANNNQTLSQHTQDFSSGMNSKKDILMLNRQRSGSVSSIGKVMVDGSGVINADGGAMAMDIDIPNHDLAADIKNGKYAAVTTSAVNTAARRITRSQLIANEEPNYTPTTPQSLSRRLLHKASVGYLDEAVPLLTSALSDRFLATVLVQAMACRDRRIEGYKATLRQRKRRMRHRRRVLLEQESRDIKTMKKLKIKGGEDYEKMAADVDVEEEYYDSYFGKGKDDDDWQNAVDGKGDKEYNSEDDDDDVSDDDELIGESLYDLKLRDLVRPLSAWGFDLTGKLGFHDDDDDDIDRRLQDAEYYSASDEDDLDDEEDNDEGDNNDESDNGDVMTDDEGPAASPKKKKKPTTSQSKTKKTATATTKKKAATKKRKRDEKEGVDGNKDDKKDNNGEPKGGKAATESAKNPSDADKK